MGRGGDRGSFGGPGGRLVCYISNFDFTIFFISLLKVDFYVSEEEAWA
jgi:hypothetical protein